MSSEELEHGFWDLTIDGQYYRVPDLCPHRGGKLIHGEVNERRRTITCPLHYSVFSLETGEQLSGPECGRLEVFKQQKPVRQP
jgi:nitrite reductase/ring-hydroxylating ferredoxin subunit